MGGCTTRIKEKDEDFENQITYKIKDQTRFLRNFLSDQQGIAEVHINNLKLAIKTQNSAQTQELKQNARFQQKLQLQVLRNDADLIQGNLQKIINMEQEQFIRSLPQNFLQIQIGFAENLPLTDQIGLYSERDSLVYYVAVQVQNKKQFERLRTTSLPTSYPQWFEILRYFEKKKRDRQIFIKDNVISQQEIVQLNQQTENYEDSGLEEVYQTEVVKQKQMQGLEEFNLNQDDVLNFQIMSKIKKSKNHKHIGSINFPLSKIFASGDLKLQSQNSNNKPNNNLNTKPVSSEKYTSEIFEIKEKIIPVNKSTNQAENEMCLWFRIQYIQNKTQFINNQKEQLTKYLQIIDQFNQNIQIQSPVELKKKE